MPLTPLEYFGIIREHKDATPRRHIEALGELKTEAAFAILKRSVDEMEKRWAKQYVFSAMRHFLSNEDLRPGVIEFAREAALGRDGATAKAATGAMLGWDEKLVAEALYEVAENGWIERARTAAIKALHGELVARADAKALRTVLEAYWVPASGSAEQGIEVLRAFTAPQHFSLLVKFMKDRQVPLQRMLLVIDAMGSHPAGADEAMDKSVDSVLRVALEHRDYVVQYRALRAVAHRGATANRRAVANLLKSKEKSVRRAALLAALRTQDSGRSGRGPRRLDAVAMAADDDPVMRQAAAIGLAEIDGAEALGALHLLVQDEDWVVQAEAIRSLSRIRLASSIPVLVEGLAVAKGRLRGDFRAALIGLTGKDLGQGAGSWRMFWSKEGETFEVPSPKAVAKAAKERAKNKTKGDSKVEFYGLDVLSRAFVLVVDTSGSMKAKAGKGKTRLDVAKEQMDKTLKRVADGVLFNVIPFSGFARPLTDGLMPIDEERREEALDYVQSLNEAGGTNIYDCLSTAFEDERVDTIYLLSDGIPSGGEITDVMSLRAEVGRWNSTRGVLIHAIAVGQDHPLLKGLAEDSGGKYVRVD